MYIAIAGNIGSGKTTLTGMLSERLGVKPYFEDVDNPYIGDFYEDMHRWSFNLQIYFLGMRIRKAMDILNSGSDLIQDRTIYEDACIFAANLHDSGIMSTRDFDTYMKIFDLCNDFFPKPDLLIYLKASVPALISQIRKRGRAYEMGIQGDYLESLNRRYDEWIENTYQGDVLVVNIDETDFTTDQSFLEGIMARVELIRKSK